MPQHSRLEPLQDALFDVDTSYDANQPMQDLAPTEPSWASVDIQDRARNISMALAALNTASAAQGMIDAGHGRGKARSDLELRYGNDLPSALVRAKNRRAEFLDTTNEHLLNAIGGEAMRAAQVPDDVVELFEIGARRDFMQTFGIKISDADARNEQAKRIQRSAAIIASGQQASKRAS